MTATHFGRLPGDFATYSLNDPDGAVMLCRTAPTVAMDVETGSAATEARWNISAFSVSDTSTAHVLDPAVHADAIRDCIRAARRIVFHNSAYDVPILVQAGLMRVSDIHKVEDTLVSARLAWPAQTDSNRLGSLADRVLGPEYSLLKGSLEEGFKAVNPRMSKSAMFDRLGISSPAFVAYSAFDSLLTMRVHAALPGRLVSQLNPGLPGFAPADAAYLDRREQTVNRVLLARSAVGIRFDDAAADEVVAELQAASAGHRRVLMDHGLDPDMSSLALKRALVGSLDEQGLLPDSWPTLKDGTRTTNKTWLERLEDHPVASAITAMAQADRFIKDYRDRSAGLTRNGRIHPQVSVLAAVTGRMSYKSPALQQYPPQVRRMFAFDEPITSFDWSSIEPVVIGNLAGADLSEFEGGGDMYMPIARQAGVGRKDAKTVLLAMLYGQGAASLSLRLGTTEAEAKALQRTVKAAMPEITATMRRITDYGNQYGAVQTISGRVVPLEKEYGRPGFKGYRGSNYIVQGSAYDLLAEALLSIHDEGLGDAVCLAIHDEVVCHTSAADEVQRIMTAPPKALVEAAGRVPVLRVGRNDLGLSWAAKEG
jgi:DNA polymerase-1